MVWLKRQVLREPFTWLVLMPFLGVSIAIDLRSAIFLPLGIWFWVVTFFLDDAFGVKPAAIGGAA